MGLQIWAVPKPSAKSHRFVENLPATLRQSTENQGHGWNHQVTGSPSCFFVVFKGCPIQLEEAQLINVGFFVVCCKITTQKAHLHPQTAHKKNSKSPLFRATTHLMGGLRVQVPSNDTATCTSNPNSWIHQPRLARASRASKKRTHAWEWLQAYSSNSCTLSCQVAVAQKSGAIFGRFYGNKGQNLRNPSSLILSSVRFKVAPAW